MGLCLGCISLTNQLKNQAKIHEKTFAVLTFLISALCIVFSVIRLGCHVQHVLVNSINYFFCIS